MTNEPQQLTNDNSLSKPSNTITAQLLKGTIHHLQNQRTNQRNGITPTNPSQYINDQSKRPKLPLHWKVKLAKQIYS